MILITVLLLIIIIIICLYIIFYKENEEYFENSYNICIIYPGESFRSGGQTSRITGNESSIEEQKTAILSHCDFMESLDKNVNVDIYIETYSTNYDDIIKELYDKSIANNKYYNFIKDKENYTSINDSIYKRLSILDTNQYNIIYIIRIDLLLKPLFKEFAQPKSIDKITFPNILWTQNSIYEIDNIIYPKLNPMITIVPKKYYIILKNNIIDFGRHKFCHKILNIENMSFNDIKLMLSTLHDANTEWDWNPVYRIVNRGEADKWVSPNIYYDIKENNFIDIPELKKEEIYEFNKNKYNE
jgi:hypothetical protein